MAGCVTIQPFLDEREYVQLNMTEFQLILAHFYETDTL